MADRDVEKRAAAEAAALLVRDGDRVGLGTGTTVAPMLPGAGRARAHIRCVATSVATEVAARALGLAVEPFEQLDRLDIAIDGADQIDPDGWLVKGGGGAHTREKVVARGGRPLRGDRVVGQGGRPDRAADPARAARVRAAGDAARAGGGRAAPRAAEPRRRRDRRLPRRGRRPRRDGGAAVGHAGRDRPRAVRARARQRHPDRARRRRSSTGSCAGNRCDARVVCGEDMRVLFTSTPGSGHLGPLFPFAHALRRAGHEVLVAAPVSAQARVERAGLAYLSYADPLERDLAPHWEAARASRPRGGERDRHRRDLRRRPRPGRAARRGARDGRVAPARRACASHASSPARSPPRRAASRTRASASWLTQTEDYVIRTAAPVLEELRAWAGLEPDPEGRKLDEAPYLTLTPPSFEAPGVTVASRTLRFHDAAPRPHSVQRPGRAAARLRDVRDGRRRRSATSPSSTAR